MEEVMMDEAFKPGTIVHFVKFTLAGPDWSETATVVRHPKRHSPMPAGYHRVRFEDGGVLLVHQDCLMLAGQ